MSRPQGQGPSPDGLEELQACLHGPTQEPHKKEPEEQRDPLVFKLLYDWDSREIEVHYRFVDIGLGIPLSFPSVTKMLDCMRLFSPHIVKDGLNDWYAGLVRYLQTIRKVVME